MTLNELAICGQCPVTFEHKGYFVTLLPSCLHRATEESGMLFDAYRNGIHDDFIRKSISRLKEGTPEWKLPEDPFSHLIEYYSRPIHFSPMQFATMRLLLLHNYGPVTLSKISIAGWGRYVGKPKVLKFVYTLNLLLKAENIPQRVKSKKEFAYLLPVDQEVGAFGQNIY